MFARAVLVVCGLSFLGFGVFALVAPDALAALVHFNLVTPPAVTEIRAFYGGLEIGMAAYLLIAAARPSLQRSALLALAFIFGGLAVARLLGIVVDGSGTALMLTALALEASGAALATITYLRST